MYSDWKTVVHEYVQRKNQTEVDYSLEPLFPLMTDEHVLRRKKERARRLQEGHRLRRTMPVRSETRLRLSDVSEDGRRVSVVLEMRIKHVYELLGREHAEERVERERLTLYRDGGQWRIGRLEESAAERRPFVPEPSFSDWIVPGELQEKARLHSTPYLNQDVLTAASAPARSAAYDRQKAVAYADRYWNRANPAYLEFEVDCTNYISQCLFAGGAPMNYTGKREAGWWYRGRQDGRELWSFSWAVAHGLEQLLRSSRSGLRAQLLEAPDQLDLGDVIIYDWDGDGRYQHSVIVTARDAAGMPLVNAHTTNSLHRYWDYRDSYAWTPQTVYRFFHIVDRF